jgi:hypothetical protein
MPLVVEQGYRLNFEEIVAVGQCCMPSFEGIGLVVPNYKITFADYSGSDLTSIPNCLG